MHSEKVIVGPVVPLEIHSFIFCWGGSRVMGDSNSWDMLGPMENMDDVPGPAVPGLKESRVHPISPGGAPVV